MNKQIHFLGYNCATGYDNTTHWQVLPPTATYTNINYFQINKIYLWFYSLKYSIEIKVFKCKKKIFIRQNNFYIKIKLRFKNRYY